MRRPSREELLLAGILCAQKKELQFLLEETLLHISVNSGSDLSRMKNNVYILELIFVYTILISDSF